MRVELYPFGQRRKPNTLTELKIALRCVLEFLVDLHANNYVHRDLRWPNILRNLDGSWFVIDLETAGPNNQYLLTQKYVCFSFIFLDLCFGIQLLVQCQKM